MTDPAPAIPPPVAEQLQLLRPVYDEIKALQGERDRLTEAGKAAGELDRSLAEEQRAFIEAVGRRDKLRRDVRQLEQPAGATPVIVSTRRAVLPAGPSTDRPVNAWTDLTLPSAAAGADREELTTFVRRFLKYDLSDAYPEMLAAFNQIMNSAERPVGEGLALLDWEVAYCKPRGSEEGEPQKWAARLEGWGKELEKYRTALANDVQGLRPSVEGVLPHLDAWLARTADPGPWAAYVAAEKAKVAAKRAQVEVDCAKLSERLAQPRVSQGRP